MKKNHNFQFYPGNLNFFTPFIILFLFFSSSSVYAKTSTCFGSTSSGRLENAVLLPSKGKNYVGYSNAARLAGRTYVHSIVKKIIVNAYLKLEKTNPDKIYKYAETGFKNGGQFKPHKTHRNGLSVDFMTPVLDASGNSVHLPTNLFNKFGYAIEFKNDDHYKGLRIDYSAMAAHITTLHQQAEKQGYDLWRVIFDPKLQPNLYKTKYANYLKKNIQFSTKPAWVRHDEHYHIDFLIPCSK